MNMFEHQKSGNFSGGSIKFKVHILNTGIVIKCLLFAIVYNIGTQINITDIQNGVK